MPSRTPKSIDLEESVQVSDQDPRHDTPDGPITGNRVVPSSWQKTLQGGPMLVAGDTSCTLAISAEHDNDMCPRHGPSQPHWPYFASRGVTSSSLVSSTRQNTSGPTLERASDHKADHSRGHAEPPSSLLSLIKASRRATSSTWV
jgi:hypothetical protein